MFVFKSYQVLGLFSYNILWKYTLKIINTIFTKSKTKTGLTLRTLVWCIIYNFQEKNPLIPDLSSQSGSFLLITEKQICHSTFVIIRNTTRGK